MCGIAGVITRETGCAERYRRSMELALGAMAHRGPDASGLWASPHAVLGHRRLSIIDLSDAGIQPMHDTENGLHITFNGEIYNYKALREEVESRGYRLRTHTDTEVILGAYRCFGEGFLDRLRGMFAFALYDEPHRKVLLCRDRLGKKPLYYHMDGERLIVSSELKALYAFDDLSPTLDVESVRAFLCLQYVPGPQSICKEIMRVEPGGFVSLDLRSWTVAGRKYWSFRDHIGPAREASDEDLARVVEESVGYRLVADVEVGVLLSGGIDSSLLASFAAELSSSRIKAFVVTFEGLDIDESAYSREVAGSLGLELVEVAGGSLDPSVFERVVHHADEPLGDPACIPTFMIAEAISKHLKVVLSGEGADELFWGYDHYRREMLLKRICPFLGRSFLPAPIMGWLGRIELDPRSPDMVARLCKVLQARHDRGVSRWTSIFGDSAAEALLPPYRSPEGEARGWDYPALPDSLRSSVGFDLAYWLPDDLLVKVDRMTMAHGLEARAPFLDHHLVEMALGLPDGDKADLRESKRVLRRLLGSRLPSGVAERIAGRRKHGFDVPLDRWLRHDLREVAEECFQEGFLREVGFIDVSRVRSLWESFLAYGGSTPFARKIWVLLCFFMWYKKHSNQFGICGRQ
ncbi:MAG: asparagine synthase (glutamine-hydrolyzing) [Acidobacteriota bacterium]